MLTLSNLCFTKKKVVLNFTKLGLKLLIQAIKLGIAKTPS